MAGLRSLLQDIYEENGRLTPTLVVAAAEPPEHPLHHRIWGDDDATAAYKHRLTVAAGLIREVRVRYAETAKGERKDVRSWHSVYSPDAGDDSDSSYMPIEDVAADPLLSAIVLRNAEREWKALRRRYGHLQEFLTIVREDVA